jgi:hypothetical protein
MRYRRDKILTTKDKILTTKDKILTIKDKNSIVFCLSCVIIFSSERQNLECFMSSEINLRRLEYSPTVNPLVDSTRAVKTKRSLVRAGTSKAMVDIETGEISQVSIIHQIKEKDDIEFVKVFAAGIAAAYELTKTASRVFQAVLQEYENTPMSGGFVDSVTLFWFDGGLSGVDLGMSEKSFQRGLKELLAKGFLSPKVPNQYWVNPALFFKGDRVRFITEYERKREKTSMLDSHNA